MRNYPKSAKRFSKSKFCDSLTLTDKCIKTDVSSLFCISFDSWNSELVLFYVRCKTTFSPEILINLSDFQMIDITYMAFFTDSTFL